MTQQHITSFCLWSLESSYDIRSVRFWNLSWSKKGTAIGEFRLKANYFCVFELEWGCFRFFYFQAWVPKQMDYKIRFLINADSFTASREEPLENLMSKMVQTLILSQQEEEQFPVKYASHLFFEPNSVPLVSSWLASEAWLEAVSEAEGIKLGDEERTSYISWNVCLLVWPLSVRSLAP